MNVPDINCKLPVLIDEFGVKQENEEADGNIKSKPGDDPEAGLFYQGCSPFFQHEKYIILKTVKKQDGRFGCQ